VLKKFRLCCFCLVAPLMGIAAGANAQFLAPVPAAPAEPTEPAAPPIPDEVRVTLMVRNAVVALSQANLTGNYSVLRDMGTPSFQITNSSARLGEAFTTLRARRIDLSPVMFFTPKLISPPAYQEGQVLRVAGYFPTTPEQVHFDIAFQKFGEQWMIAGIAVNVAPPGEGPQASAAPETQTASDTSAKPGEAKPIRIDLSQPAAPGTKPAPPKKPAAVKKPKQPAQQKTAAAQSGATPATPAEQPAPAPAPAQTPAPEPAPAQKEFGAGWNPFGR
jgi:hypothetical protein